MKQNIQIYDTTLRDGAQAEDFSLSVEDKVRIALMLDELGVAYIEGGWPGSNPKDDQFFKEMKKYALKHSKLVAFGSTHHPNKSVKEDNNLRSLLAAKTPVINIFGKSWTVHVRDALHISLARNLELIYDSLKFLRPKVGELFYDAEHFFDGYRADSKYALATIEKAIEAKVDCVVLCDTNGGSLPKEVEKIFGAVVKRFPETKFGIHAHNDTDCAVANSLMAVEAGAVQVQGTINGIGERCGNANLCSLIPNLYLKMGHSCLPDGNLSKLRAISQFVFEQANLQLNRWQPYVGRSAFAHKGGIHASAVLRNPKTYEHIDPTLVGNKRRIPISDQSGKTSLATKAGELGISLEAKDPVVMQTLQELKELENYGFQFELAEASFELLLNKIMKKKVDFFELISRHISDRKSVENNLSEVEATLWIRVGKKTEHVVAFGDGPVHALDCALRKALEPHYPILKKMKLTDYKVRVLPGTKGTAARVRVLVESANGNGERWHTMGVSHDIIEASWQALADSMNYKLYKSGKPRQLPKKSSKVRLKTRQLKK